MCVPFAGSFKVPPIISPTSLLTYKFSSFTVIGVFSTNSSYLFPLPIFLTAGDGMPASVVEDDSDRAFEWSAADITADLGIFDMLSSWLFTLNIDSFWNTILSLDSYLFFLFACVVEDDSDRAFEWSAADITADLGIFDMLSSWLFTLNIDSFWNTILSLDSYLFFLFAWYLASTFLLIVRLLTFALAAL
ncbi:hypothetical protein AYI69_g3568 [Smittium culicis]|uniref:Uncharacterized protein n=1 Tax=Smittium culicis TaxID=133412 RepID=A0A1R1YJV5_9FUNG|nr:hypothetical protein AYI69_g3568 [Smittium culicis]